MSELTGPADRFRWLAVVLSYFLALGTLTGQVSPPPSLLKITILDGDQAINNIRQRTAREPIVQVEDENHNRVPGAVVVFMLPGNGAGGSFLNGAKTLTAITDSQGKAVANSLRPNNIAGKFEIRVNASYQGKTGHAVITQTNAGAEPVVATHTARWLTIAAIAGGAVVGGVLAATRGGGGGGGGPTQPPPVPTITAGVGTVGPPR